MRNVGGGVQGRERVYVPDVDGEPIRVILRTPNLADKRQYKRAMLGIASPTEDDVVLEALRICVVRIEDYTRDDESGKAVPIATVEDLILYGEMDVVDDVGAHVLPAFAMTFAQKKTRGKRSGSSSPETPQNAIAASVSMEGSAAQEAATSPNTQTATSS